MTERISYWLVPAEPDKALLAKVISELAAQYDAPVFEPHVTIYSGPFDARDDVNGIVDAATDGLREIVMHTTGLSRSEQFTKTLFVEFVPNEALSELSEELKRRSACAEDYELRPHLSLIYASLSSQMKEQIIGRIQIPAFVRFDGVKAITSRARIASVEDVRSWRVIAEKSLGQQ